MRRIGGTGIGLGGPRKRGSITSFARHFRRHSYLFPDDCSTQEPQVNAWEERLKRRIWIALILVCTLGAFPFLILYGSNVQAGRLVFWLALATFFTLFQLPRFRRQPRNVDANGVFNGFCTICEITTQHHWSSETEKLSLECTVCASRSTWNQPYFVTARCPKCQCRLAWTENYDWTLSGSCNKCNMRLDSLPPVHPK